MAQLLESVSPVAPLFDPYGANAILVGCSRSNPDNGVWWIPEQGGHAISFGMTRCGKGLQIIGALTQYSGSTLVIDPKGENAWATAERRRQLGQRVVILDPFDEVNRRYASLVGEKETTTKFNPLSVIDPKSPDYAEDVMMLAEAVIIPGGHDPHWTDSARALVAGLIAATIENSPRGHASFRQVRKLLTSTDAELTAAIKILHARNPDSFAGRNLRRFATGTKEVASIRSTADTQTFPFESLRLLDSMETDANAFDFAELATGRVSVFLVLPVDRLATYGRWLRLIITLAIRAITRAPRPPSPPVLFILDELGTINPGGGLRMVEQAFGLMAGLGIRIWAFLQDLKQLQHDYPNSWETFISNSELVQLLKVNDNTTAEYFSNYIGQKEVLQSHITADPIHFDSSYVQINRVNLRGLYEHIRGAGLERIMRADQIIDLGPADSLCMFSGGKVFQTRKVNYYADPRFRGHHRPNPLFGGQTAPKPKAAPRPAATASPPYRPALPPRPAPWSRPLPAAPAQPAPVPPVAEPEHPAAPKSSGWFASLRQSRQEAARVKREQAAMAERARHMRMIRDAK